MTPNVDVRRLAAVDMYGARGTLPRRRVILVEFVLGAVGGTAFGILALTSWTSTVGLVTGSYLLGVAVNYGALALHGLSLFRACALDEELDGVDVPGAIRHANTAQFWIFVPVLLAALAVAGMTRR